ncbi:TGS domain-containing protein [Polyangium mundeleinium]|uniref:TGS domain-containing protein n=1 Tax=Polyangium mundeleinium TaxID=2995306 RepID=A0ABT5EUB5_9BACT|nr:TGS domain-containing protein [Polyangium mundeleinium]MDC0745418.1 TGS domain-containing protein [Polyangium mundeleinium]
MAEPLLSAETTDAILERLGAHEACIAAARLFDSRHRFSSSTPPKDRASQIASAAARALSIRWVPGGRTPASHAVEAVIALAGDAEGLLVAVAAALARLHGGRHEPDGLQRGHEALSVWAPVASRFHLKPLQRELEDLAFKIVDRPGYDAVARFVAARRADRDQAVEAAKADLEGALAALDVEAEVTGRAKHLWSLHQKLAAQSGRQPRIYDLFGLRVIVADEARCYEALGAIHAAYTAIPERFKDYIANPKANGYRSLHTVVCVPAIREAWIEIQIRTRAMHELAEHGGAAHFRYKYPDHEESRAAEARFVYTRTPRGEVRRLPRGATPLDFAYAIHTEIGWGSTGAKVNGRLVPLTTRLHTGDVVEVMHSARARPTVGQLGRVQTPRARNRIRAALPEGSRPPRSRV